MATVGITKYASDALYKVYFTDSEADEKNAELLKGCNLTDYPSTADVKVYITEYSNEADIRITRRNFPR